MKYEFKGNNKSAGYIRYSSLNQSEESVEHQKDAIRDYCEENNLVVVRWYVDEAYSGTNDNRPSLQQLLRDAENFPEWNNVVVFKLDRFSRSQTDYYADKRTLIKNGVRLISVTEPICDESEMARTFELLNTFVNESTSRAIGQHAMQGLKTNAKTARHCGGVAALGYDIDSKTKKMIVNEEEAKTVKLIFSLYLSGISFTEMAAALNSLGMKTKTGKPFSKNSFYDLLTNEKYTGDFVWGKRASINGKHYSHKYNPTDEWIIVEEAHEPIISKEDFEKVQAKLEKSKSKRSSTKHPYMLKGSGKLKCGYCGSELKCFSCYSHGKLRLSYYCPKAREKKCSLKQVDSRKLDYKLAELISEHMNYSLSLEDLEKKINRELTGTQADNVKRKLEHCRTRIKNLNNQLSFTSTTCSSTLSLLQELEAQEKKYEAELEEIRSSEVSLTPELYSRVKVRMIEEAVGCKNLQVKSMVNTMIEKIEIDNENVTVILHC